MENKKSQSSEKEEQKEKRGATTLNEFGNHVERFAVKTSESIKKFIDKALSSRNTVLTIRVNDESNKKINMLVDAGLFRSRSESCAFLIQEGIKSQESLFKKITEKLIKMDKIRDELKDIISEELNEKQPQKK